MSDDEPTLSIRGVIRAAHVWPENIPIRVKRYQHWVTISLDEASDAEYADAVIGWLEPYIHQGPDGGDDAD